MYLTHHKVEGTKVLNGQEWVIAEELLVYPNDFITISGIERANMGVRNKDKCTFTIQNEFYNEEAMGVMIEVTGLTTLDLYQESWDALEN